MTKKVMKLIDSKTGEMKCKVCGYVYLANKKAGGHFKYGSWQCPKGCKLD